MSSACSSGGPGLQVSKALALALYRGYNERGFSLWGGIETIFIPGVDMRIAGIVPADGIVCDVLLDVEVAAVADAVLVASGVPDLAGKLLADRE